MTRYAKRSYRAILGLFRRMLGVDKRYLYRRWLSQRIHDTDTTLNSLFLRVKIDGIDAARYSLRLFQREYSGKIFLKYPKEAQMIRELFVFRRILKRKRRIARVLLNKKCQLYREYRALLAESFRQDFK